ncbi:molecular chaperone TorD family protein [Shewanella sp. C32]|uniref:Molecular chaperone TorD family protein n=1 Tax=Shewanella electrica TaxID=515560 RepID=A0ABT2FIE0_9GAMM|nr:molecular chaperone TorD family protein [Shewanella electrica]MCH1924197.1 molecular chaperone TorD family protein [Shewanella electrica]MCS4556100.1 molecular chaperone TorD family protein [Shewanella electrica]
MTTTATAHLSELRAIANILHNVFFNEPTAPSISQLAHIFANNAWPPLSASTAQTQGLELLQQWSVAPDSLHPLKLEFGRLFIGPRMPAAPPWGSVYTDEQQLLNGSSTQALMQFFKTVGISFSLSCNQPLDHAGLIFAAIAVLLDNMAQSDNPALYQQQLHTLLQLHTAPWIFTFLDTVIDTTDSDFYRGFAYLAQAYLHTLQHQLLSDSVGS